jgi:alkylhydroperoxidase/carboxymuconolactone decarboxylase family protein YurZ
MSGDDIIGADGVSARARRERIQGSMTDAIEAHLAGLDPMLPGMADRFVFADVWGRPDLDHESRVFVAIAHLSAGKHIGPLRSYLRGAVEAGISTRKLHEVVLMSVVYCGWAVGLEALAAWKQVLAETGHTLDDPAVTD